MKTLIATETATSSEPLDRKQKIHSVGVPGLVKGMWEMQKAYESTQNWKTLMNGAYESAKKLAKNNIEHLNEHYKNRHLIKSEKLLETVEIIRKTPDDFYNRNSTLAQMFVKDIQEMGGLLTLDHMESYK